MADRDVVVASMQDAETKAWDALAGYKFWMFGYHAARWVNYNSLLPQGTRFRNPFRRIVRLASEHVEKSQDHLPALELTLPESAPSLLGSEGDGA